jgi:hypothetical protein
VDEACAGRSFVQYSTSRERTYVPIPQYFMLYKTSRKTVQTDQGPTQPSEWLE